MPLWTIAKKDLRLLVRDRRALLLLVAMPLLFILILGLLLGETFGQKPDDRQRVTIVDLDQGYSVEGSISWLALMPGAGGPPAALNQILTTASLVHASGAGRFPHQAWSKLVQHDLAETAEIRLETIGRP